MTLYKLIEVLREIALRQPLVRTTGEGNIYEMMNTNPKIDYGVFFVTQQTHTQDEGFDHYNLVLLYCDRLVSDLDDNRLQVQSIGKEILTNIIRTLEEEYEEVDISTISYTTFTQRFADETAGCYVQLTFDIPLDYLCAEDYE